MLLLVLIVVWGLSTAPFNWHGGLLPRDPVPVDAIPDIGENQQIVATEWMGRSPKDMQEQVTYCLLYTSIRRDKLKKDGTAPIFCRITISQEKVSFNIKAAINTGIWESSTGRAIGKSREALGMNKIIDSYTSLINEKYNEIFDRDGIV